MLRCGTYSASLQVDKLKTSKNIDEAKITLKGWKTEGYPNPLEPQWLPTVPSITMKN